MDVWISVREHGYCLSDKPVENAYHVVMEDSTAKAFLKLQRQYAELQKTLHGWHLWAKNAAGETDVSHLDRPENARVRVWPDGANIWHGQEWRRVEDVTPSM
jgi:hypothetical protein